MAYTVNIKRSARKAIQTIPQEKLRRQVEDAVAALADNPRPEGAKKLARTPKEMVLWRIKEGTFRIMYEIRDKELVVLIVLVVQREGVYDLLKRM